MSDFASTVLSGIEEKKPDEKPVEGATPIPGTAKPEEKKKGMFDYGREFKDKAGIP